MPLIPSSDTLIITSYPPSWDELAKYTVERMKQYCDKHGYDLHADRSQLFDRWYNPATGTFEQLPIKGFVKLDLFLHFLPHYKTIAWLDADLVVTNLGIKIEHLWSKAPITDNTHIVMPFDYNAFNATVIIAKSVSLVREFFWACNNTGRKIFLKDDWAEMNAMRFFQSTPPYDKLIALASIKELCALHKGAYEPYVPPWTSAPYEWETGCFSVHLSALTLERRIELAKFYVESEA